MCGYGLWCGVEQTDDDNSTARKKPPLPPSHTQHLSRHSTRACFTARRWGFHTKPKDAHTRAVKRAPRAAVPAPRQGWLGAQRRGLAGRARASRPLFFVPGFRNRCPAVSMRPPSSPPAHYLPTHHTPCHRNLGRFSGLLGHTSPRLLPPRTSSSSSSSIIRPAACRLIIKEHSSQQQPQLEQRLARPHLLDGPLLLFQ